MMSNSVSKADITKRLAAMPDLEERKESKPSKPDQNVSHIISKEQLLTKLIENPQQLREELKILCDTNIDEYKEKSFTPYSLQERPFKNAIFNIRRLIKSFSGQSDEEARENCFQLRGLLLSMRDGFKNKTFINKLILKFPELLDTDCSEAYEKIKVEQWGKGYYSQDERDRYAEALEKLKNAIRPFENEFKNSKEAQDFSAVAQALLAIDPVEATYENPDSDQEHERLADIFELFTGLIELKVKPDSDLSEEQKSNKREIENQLKNTYRECTSGPKKFTGLAAMILGGLVAIAGLISLKVTWGLSAPLSQQLIAGGAGVTLYGVALFCNRNRVTETSRKTTEALRAVARL